MKLLLKQYLSSLKERDELDVVLPDILSEVGFQVISRPKRGTKQYGVDVAAIGENPKTGKQSLFLFSIKSGDLRRADWDTGQQALRRSLNEILDFYIPKHIPKRYKSLPVVVAMCFGGDIQEDIRPTVDSFVDKHTITGQIDFDEWNGDYLADLIGTGLLRENMFPDEVKSAFRKAVAFVDEPTVCLSHFYGVVQTLGSKKFKKKADRLTAMRQIYLASWTIFVWSRDEKNLEAAYLCSEIAVLWIWDLTKDQFAARSKVAKEMESAVNKMIVLHRAISAAYLDEHVYPLCKMEDGLGSSVPSSSSLDVNLKLFDALGRVAIHGLWLILTESKLPNNADLDLKKQFHDEILRTGSTIEEMVRNNSVYFNPIRDDHAIEITICCHLLMYCEQYDFIQHWIDQIALASMFAHRRHGYYPCTLRDYGELSSHPQNIEGYQEEVTKGSILYPTLAVWMSVLRDSSSLSHLADFCKKHLSHCTLQLWLPGDDSERHYYRNSDMHGVGFDRLNIEDGPEALIKQIEKEIKASSAFHDLSAIRADLWPIILMASRVYRLPVPPQYWVLGIGERIQSAED